MSSTSTGFRPGRIAGFTLVELFVGLAIMAMLLLLALAGYREWIADEQLMNHARLLASNMNEARSEAIKRGTRVNLCKSSDGMQCATTGGWEQGFLMHDDTDATGDVDDLESVIRYVRAPSGIRVSANRPLANYVSYTSLGHARMVSGALQMGTFTVCKTGRRAIEVVLVASGRVRIDRIKSICP